MSCGSVEFARILEAVAERFPQQRAWQDLLAKAQRLAKADSRVGSGSGQADGEEPGLCPCCQRQLPEASGDFCRNCRGLYAPRPARIVPDTCDCGHAPAGRTIYVHLAGAQGSTLCSLECVRQHWQKLFSFFLRRSS